MTARRLRVSVCFLMLFAGLDAVAAIRLTGIDGREVVLQRGPAVAHARATARPRQPVSHATINVNAGPDIDAANNDFRRIQDALDAANNGDTIVLSGTFDFTQPFAAAAWALGDDNTASTADDYLVNVPAGLDGVTLTATTLGDATIQGPGDLASFDLEAFLVFEDGDNQNWTVSNLRVLDFDLGIAMFYTTSTSFNGTTIQNNFIRVPEDLNATVAPADVLQNIGIHFSFGTGQSILNNTIELAGNGVSDAPNLSSEVGMQSNTSGGAVYDGLTISGNIVHVLNAQSANPERILGIWENAHGHTSNIDVTNNSFLNDAPGNDPALNLQRAFRLTSHSSPTTTVTYSGNFVVGANIGLEWISGSDFTGNQAIVVTNSTISNCDTGILVQSNGIAHLEHNLILANGSGAGIHVITGMLTGFGANPDGIFQCFVTAGSADGIWIESTAGAIAPISQNDLSGNTGFGLRNESAPSIVAETNWWGNNLAASVAGEVSGSADVDPWLASFVDVSAASGFQPFTYATTSGTITTFLGTGSADIGALLAGDPVTMQMDGDTAVTELAQLLNFDVQLGGSDDVFTLGQTGSPDRVRRRRRQRHAQRHKRGSDLEHHRREQRQHPRRHQRVLLGREPGRRHRRGFLHLRRGGQHRRDRSTAISAPISWTTARLPASTITPSGPGTLDGFMGTATGVGVDFDNIDLIAGSPADLSVTKTGPPTVTQGDPISYSITVTNDGPNAAVNVQLIDMLPAGTTFLSLVSPGGWSCTTPAVGAAGTVTCTRATMPVESDPFTLNVTATGSGLVVNTAAVSSANEGAAGNESSAATTSVSPAVTVPTLDEWALLAMIGLLGALALKRS